MKLYVDILTLKNELIKKHGKVCGYCNCSLGVTSPIELDNYRPKSLYPKLDFKIENTIISCTFCNRIKSNKDPISKTGKILILNPYEEEYSNHMKTDENGLLHGLTEEGSSTISLLSLNRPDLVEYRLSNSMEYIDSILDKSNNPYQTYKTSIANIQELLKLQIKDENINYYFLRIIFANLISLMESYLSKTMMILIHQNEDLKWSFVRKYEWNKPTVKMQDLKESYENIDTTVQNTLFELLYHNLTKIRVLYKDILNIKILQTENEIAFLNNSVNIRHDIVHRNGRSNKVINTKEEYHNITLDEIDKLIGAIDNLINSIESQKDKLYNN